MPRQGYLLVSKDHSLFLDEAARRIESRAQAMIAAISAERPEIPVLQFVLKPLALGGKSEARVATSLFSNGPLPDIRVIFSRAPLRPKEMNLALEGSKLCLIVTEVDDNSANIVRGSSGNIQSTFTIEERYSERLLEEIIVDITLGNFFSKTQAVGSIIHRFGLRGLYRKKVQYVRSMMPTGWLNDVTKSAGYVTLSSLDNLPLADVRTRGLAAYDRWLQFSQWLEPQVRGPSERTRRAIAKLKLTPLLGGQLPLNKIERSIARLPDGRYTLVILRSSAKSRKSPSMRKRFQSIFGPSRRVNAFTIFTLSDFLIQESTILPLVQSGHLACFTIDVNPTTIEIFREV